MTQVLPQDYDFDVGTEPWPSTHQLYCMMLDSSGLAERGHLNSAYQGANAGDGYQMTNAAISRVGGSSNEFYFAFRDLYADDVTVRGTFREISTTGPLDADGGDFDPVGVLTWVQGGSVVEDNTTTAHIDQFDGIMFEVNPSGINIIFRVYEVFAGSVNQKASVSLANSSDELQGVDYEAPVTLSVTAAINGGNTEVTCSVTGFGVLENYDPFSGAVSFTTGISPVAGTANRAGFQMRAAAGDGDVHLIEVLEVESSGGTILLRDEFDRYGLGGYQLAPADALGNQGRYLSGGWFWDQFSYDEDSDGAGDDGSGPLLLNDSAAGRAYITAPGFTSTDLHTCALISARKASDISSQHRSVDIQIDATPTSGALVVGLILHASQPLPQTIPEASNEEPGLTGYAAVWRYSNTVNVWQIRRYTGSGFTIIASLTDPSPYTYWNGLATDHTFELEVYTLSGATVGGPVVLEFSIDGVTLPLTAAAVTGISDDGAGVISDASDDRIVTGGGEGLFWGRQQNTPASQVDFSNWTQLALTNAGKLSPNDQASVSIADEGQASASGTLSDVFAPEFPVESEFLNPLLRADYDSGHVATVPKFIKAATSAVQRRRTLSLRSTVVTKADRDALWTFYDDHLGPEVPFNYTSPLESTSRIWRFVDEKPRETKVAPGLYRFAFKIQEVL